MVRHNNQADYGKFTHAVLGSPPISTHLNLVRNNFCKLSGNNNNDTTLHILKLLPLDLTRQGLRWNEPVQVSVDNTIVQSIIRTDEIIHSDYHADQDESMNTY